MRSFCIRRWWLFFCKWLSHDSHGILLTKKSTVSVNVSSLKSRLEHVNVGTLDILEPLSIHHSMTPAVLRLSTIHTEVKEKDRLSAALWRFPKKPLHHLPPQECWRAFVKHTRAIVENSDSDKVRRQSLQPTHEYLNFQVDIRVCTKRQVCRLVSLPGL